MPEEDILAEDGTTLGDETGGALLLENSEGPPPVPPSFDEILEYYASLLIYQYRAMPKAHDTIKMIVNQALCDGIFLEFSDAFKLDTAVGDQLTIIGKIVGVPRNVFGLDLSHTFFNFTRYDGEPASTGFNRYTTPVDTDLIARWLSNQTYVMNDFEMLAVIKLKIIYNSTSTFSQLKRALYRTFSGYIDVFSPDTGRTYFNFTRFQGTPDSIGFNRFATLVDADNIERWADSGVMKLIYNVRQPYYSAMAVAEFLDIIPRSMGVKVIVNQI